MRIINLTYLIGPLLLFASCHNETTDTIDNIKVNKEKSTDLKFDFKKKTKTLKATNLSEKASLAPRHNHASLVFDNKMWILGGNTPKASNDVFFSNDGAHWRNVTEKANFPSRYQFGATVFKGKMWIAGGAAKIGTEAMGSIKNDVWSSKNGIEWKKAASKAQFSKRFDHTLTAFNGSLWLIGGLGYSSKANMYEPLSDIWRSTDGRNWKLVTNNAPFGPRRWHATIAHNGRLWVVGGGENSYNNDVWYSKDGYRWTQATDNADFSPRGLHALTTDGKRMWLTAGHGQNSYDYSYSHQNDIWYSTNGANWYTASVSQEFPKRTQHSSVFFGGKLWVINGTGPIDGSSTNLNLSDIWSFEW